MRINSIPPKEIYNRYIHVHKKQETNNPRQGADKTELTSDAKTFSATFNAIKEAMDVRTPEETKRINEVAQQIRDNTYSVPGRAVARKILGK